MQPAHRPEYRDHAPKGADVSWDRAWRLARTGYGKVPRSRRRAATILRPLRVFIRARKPRRFFLIEEFRMCRFMTSHPF